MHFGISCLYQNNVRLRELSPNCQTAQNVRWQPWLALLSLERRYNVNNKLYFEPFFFSLNSLLRRREKNSIDFIFNFQIFYVFIFDFNYNIHSILSSFALNNVTMNTFIKHKYLCAFNLAMVNFLKPHFKSNRIEWRWTIVTLFDPF